MRIHARSLVALTAAAVVLTPTAAQAAKKSVFAGPPRPIESMPEEAHPAHFFPKKIKVRKGRSVDFHFRGFHTVTFLGGAEVPPFFIPDGKVEGYNDAAGNPFWFNGQDRLIGNPQVAFPVGDGKIDNRAYENSGLPFEEESAPVTYDFPKKGTFRYVCLVHPKMKGKVTVLPKGKRVPSAERDEVRIAREVAKVVRKAKRRMDYDGPGGNTVRAGHDNKDLEIVRFFPKDLTVPAGTTVKWIVRHPHEFHTISFGPEGYLDPIAQSFIAPDTTAPQGGPPKLVLNPLAGYPSDPPPAAPSYDGTNHGNGFLNSGIIFEGPGSPGDEWSATFTEPGEYRYICLVHGKDMAGTVTVTG